jgi:hypothetical protein
MNIDLTKFFNQVGKLYTNWLSQSIKRQQNYDGSGSFVAKKNNSFIPVKNKKTGKSHQRNVGTQRLYVTGNFAQNAFQYSVTPDSLTIKGNDATHPNSKATYADIIAYNDSDSAYLTGKRGSTIRGLMTRIFPWLEADFIKGYTTIVGNDITDDLEAEIKSQVEDQLSKEINNQIELTI